MQKLCFIIIIFGLNFLSNSVFSQNEISKGDSFQQNKQSFHSKNYCDDNYLTRYYVFDNTFQRDQPLYFINGENFNADITMPNKIPGDNRAYLPQGKSPLFKISYDVNHSLGVITGAVLLLNSHYKSETLCGITIYLKNEKQSCESGIRLLGGRCMIHSNGSGRENDPEVISFFSI